MKPLIKVSKPGYDVKKATPEQCTLHSSYPNLKTKVGKTPEHFGIVEYAFSSGVTASSTTTILQFNHGYTYIPSCVCYMYAKIANSAYYVDYYSVLPESPTGGGGIVVGTFRAYCDSTQFTLDFNIGADIGFGIDNMALSSWVFKYYIFAEDGT